MIGVDASLPAPLEDRMDGAFSRCGPRPRANGLRPSGCGSRREHCSSLPPTLTMPLREMRRSNFRTERKAASGSGRKCGRCSAKASLTTRKVVACTRGLATLSNRCHS